MMRFCRLIHQTVEDMIVIAKVIHNLYPVYSVKYTRSSSEPNSTRRKSLNKEPSHKRNDIYADNKCKCTKSPKYDEMNDSRFKDVIAKSKGSGRDRVCGGFDINKANHYSHAERAD